ncbi:MAG: universal stress protein [Thiomargarita sp.]|nr:universal stress protein [Thiomargarita sp.]
MYEHILLASHGTIGACAAEKAAINLSSSKTNLHHLIVIPDFWKNMLGDDWLNNAITQIRYGKYVEGELAKEIQITIDQVSEQAKNISYDYEVMLGEPTNCLLEVAQRSDFDLVIIGSPRPKGIDGINSRISSEILMRNLAIPLLIIPYP